MKYKLAMAFAIAAVMVLSVMPMTSDEADAYDIIGGDAGVGYSVNDLSGDTLKMIYSQDRQNAAAKDVLNKLIKESASNYEFSEVVMTEFCASEYMGTSISGDVVDDVRSDSMSYKITFKATRTSATQGQLFDNEYQNAALIKEVGLDNMSQEGAVFEVTSDVEYVVYDHTEHTYATNSAGNHFVTHHFTKGYMKVAYKSDVKYTFNNDGEKTIEYTYDLGEQQSRRSEVTRDFCGVELKDVDETKRALLNTDGDKCASISWKRVKIGDSEEGPISYSYKPDESERYDAYEDVTVIERDLKVPDYKFYGEDLLYSLFSGTRVDESLRDDAKMKQFLSDNGTVKDTFSSVEKAADSYYHDLTFTDDLKQAGLVIAAAFAAFIVTVIVVVIVIALIKRKK